VSCEVSIHQVLASMYPRSKSLGNVPCPIHRSISVKAEAPTQRQPCNLPLPYPHSDLPYSIKRPTQKHCFLAISTFSKSKHNDNKNLQHHLPRLLHQTLTRTIRTLEPTSLTQFPQRLSSNDVAARHHHRRVRFRGLFFADRTDEDSVEDERAR
jgi:hypothetical protein